jgi:F-type H+-transporting ATPase subunit b
VSPGARWIRFGALILVLGGTLAAPSPVRAEEGAKSGQGETETVAAKEGGHEEVVPEPEIHGWKLAAQLFNFAALAFILIKFGGPAVSKALTARHQQLKADLAAAAEAKAAAEKRLAVQEKRLSSLEQEIAGIRAGIKHEAEAEKARLIELAEERARRIQEETKFLLDQQVKQAEADLRREAARMAVDMAEQMVKRSFDASDQKRLVDGFVGDVAAVGGRSSGGAA